MAAEIKVRPFDEQPSGDTNFSGINYVAKDAPFEVVGPGFAAGVATLKDGKKYIDRFGNSHKGQMEVYPKGEVPPRMKRTVTYPKEDGEGLVEIDLNDGSLTMHHTFTPPIPPSAGYQED